MWRCHHNCTNKTKREKSFRAFSGIVMEERFLSASSIAVSCMFLSGVPVFAGSRKKGQTFGQPPAHSRLTEIMKPARAYRERDRGERADSAI
jgi:hypothetical protein